MGKIHAVLVDDADIEQIQDGDFATFGDLPCTIILGHEDQEEEVLEALEERGVKLGDQDG